MLAFHERGRRLQIITNSDPGFDTYFSGNTTVICPVGALTTADFRFGRVLGSLPKCQVLTLGMRQVQTLALVPV